MKAKEIISYYKRNFNIKDKDKIIEDLDWQVQYVSDFSKRREEYIEKLRNNIEKLEWNNA